MEEYREGKVALCSLDREDLSISVSDVKILEEAINLLKLFEEVTHELSSDQYTSLSKVVPLARSLQRLISQCKASLSLKQELSSNMARRFTDFKANCVLCVSTLLDLHFKKISFTDPAQYQPAIVRLSREIITLNQQNRPPASTTVSQNKPTTSESQVWSHVDSQIENTQQNSQPLQSLCIIGSFLDLMILTRKECPLKWWQNIEESFFHWIL